MPVRIAPVSLDKGNSGRVGSFFFVQRMSRQTMLSMHWKSNGLSTPYQSGKGRTPTDHLSDQIRACDTRMRDVLFAKRRRPGLKSQAPLRKSFHLNWSAASSAV